MSTKEFGPEIRCTGPGCPSDTFVVAGVHAGDGPPSTLLHCVVCESPVYIKIVGAPLTTAQFSSGVLERCQKLEVDAKALKTYVDYRRQLIHDEAQRYLDAHQS